MNLGNSAAKAISAGLSDEDLIRRYCADPPDEQAGEQLFSRCLPRLQSTIRKLVYAKSSMCPDWYSRDMFTEDAVGIANEKLVRGIPTFDFKSPFDHWLGKLAKNAAIDVRRKLVGRGKEPNPRPEPVEKLTDADIFRSQYWVDPSAMLRDREMHEIVHKILALHLQCSPEDRESPDAIAAYFLEEKPVQAVAQTLDCSERSVWRLFAHDYPELQELAIEEFGITKTDDL